MVDHRIRILRGRLSVSDAHPDRLSKQKEISSCGGYAPADVVGRAARGGVRRRRRGVPRRPGGAGRRVDAEDPVCDRFLLVAAGSYAFAVRAFIAAWERRPNWLPRYIRGQGGAYIALWTAIVVVSVNELPVVWLILTAVGAPLIEWLTRRARNGPPGGQVTAAGSGTRVEKRLGLTGGSWRMMARVMLRY
jgi:hypothetical protein